MHLPAREVGARKAPKRAEAAIDSFIFQGGWNEERLEFDCGLDKVFRHTSDLRL